MLSKKTVTERNVDNVGKSFIAIQSQKSSKVFRVSCELHQPINGRVLNKALQKLIHQFPFYQVEIKNGLFWPYLKKSTIQPVATPDAVPACGQLYRKSAPGLLYEVTYNKNWIHFEVFHALTDGMGASLFLRMLAIAYLLLLNGRDVNTYSLTEAVGLSKESYTADGFDEHYAKPQDTSKSSLPQRAYQVKAPTLKTNANADCRVVIRTNDLLEECHRLGATAAEFLTAVYVKAFYDTMGHNEEQRPVTISVPVNLRSLFGCNTARNFFAVIKTKHASSKKKTTLAEILEVVRKDFTENLTLDKLQQNFSQYISIERSILRFVPLALKTPALRFSGRIVENGSTAIFSNLGRMKMPDEFAQHIKSFDLMDNTDGLKLCVISYGNDTSLHFTSALGTDAIQVSFMKILLKMGILATAENTTHNQGSPWSRDLPLCG